MDITIASAVDATLRFDDFVREDLPVVARAVAFVASDTMVANEALTAGLRSAFDTWSQLPDAEQAQQHVFGVAVAHCTPPDQASEGTAAHPRQATWMIAHHVLGMSTDDIAETFHAELDEVAEQLRSAAHSAFSNNAGDELRHAVAETDPAGFDIAAVTREDQPDSSVSVTRIALGAIAALLVLGALAQFVARPERTQRVVEPEPVASEPPTAIPAAALPVTEVTSIEPTFITTDADGGFVGLRPPSGQETTAVFSRSMDGQDWRAAGMWDIGAPVTFTRFERSGESFAVWIEDKDPAAAPLVEMVGVSRDLAEWQMLEFAAGDEQPAGLLYQSDISDLSISGENVLALVRTSVEIDFAALSLSEGYTCGHTITDDAVTVNLCNSSELDVLSVSRVDQLPERNRLFVSRSGQPFERTSEPFGRQTAARLTTANGAFAITDEAGVAFATSQDATTWQTVPIGKPPLEVLAAATGDDNQVVGVGTTNDASLVVFRKIGSSTNTIPLTDLVGETRGTVDAYVAAGPTRWVVYVFEQHTRAWILTSRDGLDWDAIPTSPPTGSEPRLLAGDDEVLLQWVDNDGELITLGVPLP